MMKRFSIFAACLFALILSVNSFAQDPAQQTKGRRKQAHKLQQMDTNKDGTISRDEWKGKPRGFNKRDKNNDGLISKDEFKNRQGKRS